MNSKIFVCSLKGLAAAFLSAAVLLLLFSFALARSSDPMKLLTLFAYAAMLVSAFIGGYTAVRFNGSDGLLCGALTGGLYAVLLVLVSIFIPSEGGCGALCVLGMMLLVIAFSAVGGILGLPKQASPEKRRKILFEKARAQNIGSRRKSSRNSK